MELIYRDMPLDYEFYDTSDAHYGPLNCHREAFLEVIAQVKAKPDRYIWHKGDGVDCVTPGDKRYATVSADVRTGWRNPQDHADQFIKDVMPVRDRFITYMVGNHEYHLINTFDVAHHIGEIAGYEPAEIGCLKGYVQGGKLVHVEKVVL